MPSIIVLFETTYATNDNCYLNHLSAQINRY